MADVTVEWDDQQTDAMLDMVALDVLTALRYEVAETARAIAPVRLRHTTVPRWAKRGYVGVPGHLKASVFSDDGRDGPGPDGRYADIAALWYGRFLDPPARQLKGIKPFLPTALFMVCDGAEFYFK